MAEDLPEVFCTGEAASWCPRCGDCTCSRFDTGEREEEESDECPLHGRRSEHARTLEPSDRDLLQLVRQEFSKLVLFRHRCPVYAIGRLDAPFSYYLKGDVDRIALLLRNQRP